MRINAEGLDYRQLNEQICAAITAGENDFVLDNIRGQRYLGTGLGAGVQITIKGVPGNDLAAFMNGTEIIVRGNVQDGTGNTMNAGKIVVDGQAGDITGYSMRGGKIFVRGDVGYRTGIHMKAYQDQFPVVVVGGRAGDYLGEYMAGGVIVVLNLAEGGVSPVGEWVGTGMHGGVLYLRGTAEPYQLGRAVGTNSLEDLGELSPADFVKLTPRNSRLYAY